MSKAQAPHIERIRVFPVKSLDGTDLDSVKITKGGSLQYDRMYALKDHSGAIVNAKKYPEIQKVRTGFDPDSMNMKIEIPGSVYDFNLDSDTLLISDWFSDYLSVKVQLHKNEETGFPDDPVRPGPSLCSRESVLEVCKWFPGLTEEEVRRRFRSNIELSGINQAFWEDTLLLKDSFAFGDIKIKAVKPCPRCPVPSRDSLTGEPMKGFQKDFSDKREKTLGDMPDRTHFPHFYMFAINTIVTEGMGKRISTGDYLTD